MTEILAFPDKAERAELTRAKFNEDFKKRWKARGDCGEFTNDIWAWEEMLKEQGWIVQLYDNIMQEFATFVNFDNKMLCNNNPKAYYTQKAMEAILDRLFADEPATGRWLFYWEEVHDEAHRHVRDGAEWEGSEDYGTVWYSMELRVREILVGEDIPLRAKDAVGESPIESD
jgi:hypothetical protein|uniref:Uncharacterized protein n=1 Tax=Myoviridae sp. ctshb19 TaxID=2825194 RepID=A0A8S5UGY0_9CAUD|nr:MAG TPA: hypothetical protein [Myoviridae sp. ctshb19]